MSERPRNQFSGPPRTFADLFCGIGGFHCAASELGLQCVFASDIDEHARRQYFHSFGMRPAGDIMEIRAEEIPDHDILCGGFPCQPFSIIGSRRGMSDRRGVLFFEIVRVLRAKRPPALCLENVRQFSSMQQGRVLESALGALRALGYTCEWRILNALDFGLPQKRERTIITGFLDAEEASRFQWPRPQPRYTPLTEILEPDPPRRYFVSDRIREKRLKKHAATCVPSIWHENKGGNVSSHPFSCALRAGASYNYLLVNGERRLTPREQLRLQGFPEDFRVIGSESQIRKQTGNAVPVPLIRDVLRQMLLAAGVSAAST